MHVQANDEEGGFGSLKNYIDRLVIKAVNKIPTIKTNSQTSLTIGPVTLQGKKWDESIKAHEKEHARQQIEYPFGLLAWLVRYQLDKKFRWAQERGAINVQIQTAAQLNLPVNWDDLYSSYLNDYRGMVSAHDLAQYVAEKKELYKSLTGHY